jgi:hypothetical protein
MKTKKQLPLYDRAEDPEYVKEHGLQIDIDYYINKQILPPILRIFEALGTTPTQTITEPPKKSQKTFGDITKEAQLYEDRKSDVVIVTYKDESVEEMMRIASNGTPLQITTKSLERYTLWIEI